MERTIQRTMVEEEAVQEAETAIKPEQPKAKPHAQSKLNLGGIKGYNEKKKAMKLLKMKGNVVTELKNALSIFDADEVKLNHTVVLFCAQIVEDIFTKSKQGELKEEIVLEVCKDYFNGDESLVKMVLELVFDKIIKTTAYRRNKEAIKNGLSWLLSIFGVKIETSLSANLKM